MPAAIQVNGGQSSGTEFWIPKEVITVGSESKADLVIPEIARHALTIHFRDGKYLAYRRCNEKAQLGNTVLPAGSSVEWPAGSQVFLSAGVSLLLRVLPDASPGLPAGMHDPTTSIATGRAKANSPQAWHYAVLAGCLVVMALLVADLAQQDEPPASVPDQFASLVSRLATGPTATDLERVAFRNDLQAARYHELRQDYGAAMLGYGTIRDRLLRQRGDHRQELPPIEGELYEFTRSRLEQIAPRAVRGAFRGL